MFTKHLPLLFLGLLLAAPATSHAQARDGQVRGMIRQAMEDYQNLEIDGALGRLRLATNLCGRSNCSPQILARVHFSIGIIAVGGQSNTSLGVQEFTEGLRLDPSSEPDAMLVTPEITAAFTTARQHAGGGTGDTAATPTATPGRTGGRTGGRNNPPTGDENSPPRGGGRGVATLLHTPVPEQVENTPVPVYVEAGSAAGATRFVVHFRGLGSSGFTDLPMDHVANGFGAEIPCGQVIRPNVEYYVTAEDSNGTVIGQTGTAQAPTRIAIVTSRTQPAPALPGRMPSEQCGEDCPPGMTGPQCRHSGGGAAASARGHRQLGDPCENNNQCGEGMHCDAGACASGEVGGGSDGGGGGNSGPPANFYRVAIDIGGGGGFGFLPGGMPNYAEYRSDYPDNPGNLQCGPNGSLQCPMVRYPGFSANGILGAQVRVNVVKWLGFAGLVRFQPNSSGVGTLPNLFLGVRAYAAVTPGGFVRRGIIIAPFVGSGVGQMQAQPAVSTGSPAHVISGLNNVHFGARAEVALGVFHLGAEGALNFQLPNFMFVIDAQFFLGVHF